MRSIPFLAESRSLITRLSLKLVSTFVNLHGGAELAEPLHLVTPLPLNLRTSVPLASSAHKIAPIPVRVGFLRLIPADRMQSMSRTLDAKGLMDQFADWTTAHRWADVKELFELWVKFFDADGKSNKPHVDLYNYYLQATLMIGASPAEMLDLVVQMGNYGISPNTASLNLVLKAMMQAGETQAAEKLIERMIQTGKECNCPLPDGKSYDLIVRTLLLANQIDSALKYFNLALKSGYMLSERAFIACIQRCVHNGRLNNLVSVMKVDANNACPPWRVCNYIADVALQSDNSELTYYALALIAKGIVRGENASPAQCLSVEEGLVVSCLGTARRTYNSRLIEGSWSVLKSSLRQKKVPSPESYLGKIYALANLGDLQKAFSTLYEFEAAYGNSDQEDVDGLFSPFYALNPLVVACCEKGCATLDRVYYQLENLGKANPPYKSLTALNCVILGYANIWDIYSAYRTFNAIDATFGLIPNIHSYNSLISALGKHRKRDEAVKVFDDVVALGIKPNTTSHALLIDVHLSMRDTKAALSVIDDLIHSGYEPSKEMLKKVRRRCVREMDYRSDDKVETLARQYKIQMGTEVRRDLLFNNLYRIDHS